MKLELVSRPKLAGRAKLRRDHRTGGHVLLYPEKGLVLNATSAAIVSRCTGELTVAEIARQLSQEFSESDVARLEREVVELLTALAERGLLAEPS
jgi:pyrroloquinoline quinone biosynthesis protein D